VSFVPLIAALDWVEAHPDDLPARSGPEWFGAVFQKLTGQSVPAPPGESKGD
jgi:hypothetical protein